MGAAGAVLATLPFFRAKPPQSRFVALSSLLSLLDFSFFAFLFFVILLVLLAESSSMEVEAIPSLSRSRFPDQRGR